MAFPKKLCDFPSDFLKTLVLVLGFFIEICILLAKVKVLELNNS
jgi:hypothetical protein